MPPLLPTVQIVKNKIIPVIRVPVSWWCHNKYITINRTCSTFKIKQFILKCHRCWYTNDWIRCFSYVVITQPACTNTNVNDTKQMIEYDLFISSVKTDGITCMGGIFHIHFAFVRQIALRSKNKSWLFGSKVWTCANYTVYGEKNLVRHFTCLR